MNRFFQITAICLAILCMASPVMAQGEGDEAPGATTDGGPGGGGGGATAVGLFELAAFGAGLVMIGAGLGIGRIGGLAVESMARQPEVADKIQTAMIISAALIEGATFFGLIVCLLQILL